jgi:hypothetical protein
MQNSKMIAGVLREKRNPSGGGFMIPMMNTYDTIRTSLHFNKFMVGELLLVEYKCPIEQDAAGVWTLTNRMRFDLQIKRELDPLSGTVNLIQ